MTDPLRKRIQELEEALRHARAWLPKYAIIENEEILKSSLPAPAEAPQGLSDEEIQGFADSAIDGFKGNKHFLKGLFKGIYLRGIKDGGAEAYGEKAPEFAKILDLCLIGGNHLVEYLPVDCGTDSPLFQLSYAEALDHFKDKAGIYFCWKNLMLARAKWEALSPAAVPPRCKHDIHGKDCFECFPVPAPATEELISKIRLVARYHGWAIGVHGSLKRDIDLIGVPWTEGAEDWLTVFNAIRSAVGKELGNITKKPNGRAAFILIQDGAISTQDMDNPKGPQTIWNPPAVDLSLVDPRKSIFAPKEAVPAMPQDESVLSELELEKIFNDQIVGGLSRKHNEYIFTFRDILDLIKIIHDAGRAKSARGQS